MSQTNDTVSTAGASFMSRNALDRTAPIKFAYREEPVSPADNGWRFLTGIDDDDYLADPDNSVVVAFETVIGIEPAVQPLLDLPEGTDVVLERDSRGQVTIVDEETGTPLAF